MKKPQVCMFCYYRNKRLAACRHVEAKPGARHDVAVGAATSPPAAATRLPAERPQGKLLI